MVKFNRSKFMTERQSRASQQKQLYENLTGEKANHSEFLRNQTPLSQSIVAYEVSYQLTYAKGNQAMDISKGDTFTVYSFQETPVTKEVIMENTKNAIQDARASTGNGFQAGTKNMIGDSLKVRVESPRGMEVIDKDITDKVISGLKSGKGFYVEQIDSSFEVKNKKGTTAKMKFDLSLYFSK